MRGRQVFLETLLAHGVDRIFGNPGTTDPGTNTPGTGMVINEILSCTNAGQTPFIELFNCSTAAVDLDGWYLTGDYGYMADGEVYVAGRKKDLIIVGGKNIYPQDIEAILNGKDYLIPGRNVAFGVENEKTGTERLVILAEARSEHMHMDLLPLRTEIMSTLGVPVSRIALLAHRTLLKGTAGKISRYLNKQAYLAGTFNKV